MAIFKKHLKPAAGESTLTSPLSSVGEFVFFSALGLALMAADTLPGDLTVGLVFGLVYAALRLTATREFLHRALRT